MKNGMRPRKSAAAFYLQKCAKYAIIEAEKEAMGNMRCGVSTACLFPCETSQALEQILACGAPFVEIFFNSFEEMKPDYVRCLNAQVRAAGAAVTALHPCTSFAETFFFASSYPSRMREGMRLYRRWFEICAEMGIPRAVFHGERRATPYPFEDYCRNYLQLRRMARGYGVDFCQENVVRCECGFPDAILKMRDALNDDVSFVLDVKQMRRADVKTAEMYDAMRGRIAYLHLSDWTQECDCTPPGTGYFDFDALFSGLRRVGFDGDMVVELYRSGFESEGQLVTARQWIERRFLNEHRGE